MYIRLLFNIIIILLFIISKNCRGFLFSETTVDNHKKVKLNVKKCFCNLIFQCSQNNISIFSILYQHCHRIHTKNNVNKKMLLVKYL